ncbi:MAG: hypothetical protein IKA65_08570, partial [Lentisphaeria bacterium]|nr:hypothetical protein [Lentisphaeria bacterium]
QERSVNRLQRALPAAVNYRYLPLFPVQHRAAHPASLHYAAASRCSPYNNMPSAAIPSHTFPYILKKISDFAILFKVSPLDKAPKILYII